MLRLVKAELFKLSKTKTFMVLCIVAFMLALMTIGSEKLISSEDFIRSSLKGMPQEQQDQYLKQLESSSDKSNEVVIPGSMGIHVQSKNIFKPTAKEIFYGSFGSGAIEVLLAVLIGAMVAKEYSSGTIKNTLAYGNKREYYYISKLISISVGLIILLAILVTVTTVICSYMFGWGEPFTIYSFINILKVFLAATLIGMATAALIMLIATILKSNGSTIGLGICIFAILPSIISFLYGKFDWFDKIYRCTITYNWALATSIKADNGDVLKAATVGLVTLLIAAAAGIAVFKKQDIK